MTCFQTLNPTIEAWTSINFSVEFGNECKMFGVGTSFGRSFQTFVIGKL
jgi:hypothetical protein